MKRLICAILFLSSCASLQDKGRLYFTSGSALGVEPAESFLERMKSEQEIRNIMYGPSESTHIIQCTLLRNQIYVASMNSSNTEIEQAVKIMEPAYQENNESFLAACDQILTTNVGKAFLQVQHQYLR